MPDDIERGRAFDLRVAFGLAVLVSVVLVVSGILTAAAGRAGLIIGTASAGFADSQSAAISAATLTHAGHASESAAVIAILAALTANTLSKAIIAIALGDRRFAFDVWPGLVLMLAGAWGGAAIAGVL